MSYKALKKKIISGQAKIGVIGLGYVGLPLAVGFAKAGFSVLGIDLDEDRICRIQARKNYISDVSTKDFRKVIDEKKFCVASQFDLVQQLDVILICVPTPIKRKYTPDISFITNAVKSIARYLKRSSLVILESTTYPGTTKELIQPALEKSGLRVGRDFFLAFSPERIDPGNKQYPLAKIPKVVGGIDAKSSELTKRLYQKIVKQVHVVSSTEVAEMTKLLENSFRIINIGWINELAMMSHRLGIDVWEVIGAAKTKPFGFMPFYPGLGVGGHCIPEDPLYLAWRVKQYGFNSKYIKLSSDTNAHMPRYAVERIQETLQKQKKNLRQARVLVVGVTYKKDVKDLRKSPPLRLIELLQAAGVQVDFFDPFIPFLEIGLLHLRSIALTAEKLKSYDCVVVATDHTKVNYSLIFKNASLIFDIRNVYQKQKAKKIFRI